VHVRTAPGSGPPFVPAGAPEGAPDPCILVLFGATGDLARRKIVPALYELFRSGALPEPFALVGFSRSARTDEGLRARFRAGLEKHARTRPIEPIEPIEIEARGWERFARRIHAVPGDVADPASLRELGKRLESVDRGAGTGGNLLLYFATPPSAFGVLLNELREVGLLRPRPKHCAGPWLRLILEKPIGHDLGSARELNALARQALQEHQIYRIDHYLGKETVQNILVLRFGNAIFEPLWNRNHVDHVQITMAEAIGVEGRGSFYEETGVVRDVVQNHLLQVLALCTMEPPVDFGPYEIRNMKSQVLRSFRPLVAGEVAAHVVHGQYAGYRDEPGVHPGSRTPTYVALKTHIDNWRWQGVPFYLRAGKCLAARVTEVTFHFRSIPTCLFDEAACAAIPPNVLKIRIQPDEGISLRIASKVPGEGSGVDGVEMDFSYAETFDRQPPDAYERLLLDCMRGDQTLFGRRDEVELSWEFVDPVLAAWEAGGDLPLCSYTPGSQGPAQADSLLFRNGHRWQEIR